MTRGTVRPWILAALLVLGALSARAQDDGPSFDPGPPVPGDVDDDGHIVIAARGEASTIASGLVLEYIIRGDGDDAAEAEKKYTKRIAGIVKGMKDEAPLTSLVTLKLTTGKKLQASAFSFKLEPQNGQNFKLDAGTTFGGRVYIEVGGLGATTPELARKSLAQVLGLLADNDLTGAEDEVDIMSAHMLVDKDDLRQRSMAQAMERARARAAALARLSGRRLGRASLITELSWSCDDDQSQTVQNYFNLVYPSSSNGWRAHLGVTYETEILVSFELE
jgi:uncharacterized protein YggE